MVMVPPTDILTGCAKARASRPPLYLLTNRY
jgi:hypothetical protein